MEKYRGKKWSDLTEEQQDDLINTSNIRDINTIGECIVVLPENMSILGEIIYYNDCKELVICKDSIICDLEVSIQNQKFKNLIGIKDASLMFNRSEESIKEDVRLERLLENMEYVKIGKELVFDKKALEKFYGKAEVYY